MLLVPLLVVVVALMVGSLGSTSISENGRVSAAPLKRKSLGSCSVSAVWF